MEIRWIIREMEKGEHTEQGIGQVQGVTRQRVNQLWNEYQQTGRIPSVQRPGRPVEPLSEEKRELIDEAYQVYWMGAHMLEDILQRECGVQISHNKIHRYMRRNGMASRNRKKQQKR